MSENQFNILRNSYDLMNPKQQKNARRIVIEKHSLKWADFMGRQSKYEVGRIEARKLFAYIEALLPILTSKQGELKKISIPAYYIVRSLIAEQQSHPKFGFKKPEKTKPATESVQ